MEFSRPAHWSGLPFLSPGDLPDPGVEPGSPALQANSLPSEPPGKLVQSQGLFTCTAVTPSHSSSMGGCAVFLLLVEPASSHPTSETVHQPQLLPSQRAGLQALGPFFKHLSFLNCNLCLCSPRVGSCTHSCYLRDAKEHRLSNFFCKVRVANMSDFVGHMPFLKKNLFIYYFWWHVRS